MTKSPSKMSRKQREEQRQMRRFMIFGGGASALVASACVGITLLPPSFPVLEGEGTMSERMERSGLDSFLLKIIPRAFRQDILVVGTTDCSHCRDFVKDGLEDAASFAREAGLGLVYAPTGSTASSLGSTRLIHGFSQARNVDPVRLLQAIYTAAPTLGSEEGFKRAAQDIAKTFGISDSVVKSLLDEGPLPSTGRIQDLARSFPAAGTPTFYVSSEENPTRILRFSGWAGTAGLRRQITTAREA